MTVCSLHLCNVQWPFVLFLCALSLHLVSAAAGSVAPSLPAAGRALLAVRRSGRTKDVFGPSGCVSLTRTAKGTCQLSTDCGSNNISATEFAFVCFNPGTNLPHALHSFGTGGFAAQETFDSGVECGRCSSVDNAFKTGGPLLRNALRVIPEAGAGSSIDSATSKMAPYEAAFFGPEACIAAYRGSEGTCMIQTKCQDIDISVHPIGITCLDKVGDYTRYVFGKGGFAPNETFDTRLECKACLGIGEDPVLQQLQGPLPKQLVDDVNSLKAEVKFLVNQVNALKQGSPVSTLGGLAKSGSTQSVAVNDREGTLSVEEEAQPAFVAAPVPPQQIQNKDNAKLTDTRLTEAPAELVPIRQVVVDGIPYVPAPRAQSLLQYATPKTAAQVTPIVVHNRDRAHLLEAPHTLREMLKRLVQK